MIKGVESDVCSSKCVLVLCQMFYFGESKGMTLSSVENY